VLGVGIAGGMVLKAREPYSKIGTRVPEGSSRW